MIDPGPKLEKQSLLDLPDEVIEDNIMCYLSLKDLHNCSKCENERLKGCSDRVRHKSTCK